MLWQTNVFDTRTSDDSILSHAAGKCVTFINLSFAYGFCQLTSSLESVAVDLQFLDGSASIHWH